MDKILLVLKREYLERVKKKSFILITLLAPVFMGLLIFASAYFTTTGGKATKKILVVDDSHIFENSKPKSSNLDYTFTADNYKDLVGNYTDQGYDMLLHIPPFTDLKSPKHNISYFSKKKLGIMTIENIERKISQSFKNYKIKQSGIDSELYKSFKTDISMDNGAIDSDDGNDKSGKLSTIIATVIGGIMGFLMYMVIFLYGAMVMRSVMEEKVNRIVELMISSIKPFQLMMGKLLGVGAVGLTQLAVWLGLIPLIVLGVSTYFGGGENLQMQSLKDQVGGGEIPVDENQIGMIIAEIYNFNWGLILPVFLIFFIGGYLIYSALFAAVGSAADDEADTQQLMLPISIPVIIAFIMLQGVISNPHGNMAIFGSMFPLFSPIIMPARLAFDPPMWQVVVSVIILILSIILFVWMAGKIYRTGILMYGKKVSLKEIGKWLFYK